MLLRTKYLFLSLFIMPGNLFISSPCLSCAIWHVCVYAIEVVMSTMLALCHIYGILVLGTWNLELKTGENPWFLGSGNATMAGRGNRCPPAVGPSGVAVAGGVPSPT